VTPGDLHADVVVRRGAFELTARLDVAAGEVLAVVGRNGAGKSTLLAAIAGTVPVARGSVRVGERLLTQDGRTVPVPQRRVGLLGQDPLLFPHLDAVANVAFAHRARGLSRAAARRAAREDLVAAGLDGLARRRPAELSGGQQQRVALARALASSPQVVLLDEPLAAVDAPSSRRLRRHLRSTLAAAQVPVLVVTHTDEDVLALADRVLRLDHGAVEAEWPLRGGGVHEGAPPPSSSPSDGTAGATDLIGRVGLDGTVHLPAGAHVPPGATVRVRLDHPEQRREQPLWQRTGQQADASQDLG